MFVLFLINLYMGKPVIGSIIEDRFLYSIPVDNNHINYSSITNIKESIKCKGFSIKYVVEGREDYYINNIKYSVFPGEYLLVNHNTNFKVKINTEKPTVGICVYFNPDLINNIIKSGKIDINIFLDNLYSNHTKRFYFHENIYKIEDDTFSKYLIEIKDLIIQNKEYQITSKIFNNLAESLVYNQLKIATQINRINSIKKSTREELYRRLHRARNYIIDNFNTDIDLNKISGIAHLSEYHFLRSFKESFGCTPHQFLLNLRMAEAELLLLKKRKIEEVAISCGFISNDTFIKCFKRYKGVSPAKYQNQYNNVHIN